MEKPSLLRFLNSPIFLSLYTGEMAEAESNRSHEWHRGARSRGKRKLLRGGAEPLLSREGCPPADAMTGTTATSDH